MASSFISHIWAVSAVKVPVEIVEGATTCQIYRLNNTRDKVLNYSALISVFDYGENALAAVTYLRI